MLFWQFDIKARKWLFLVSIWIGENMEFNRSKLEPGFKREEPLNFESRSMLFCYILRNLISFSIYHTSE